MFIVKNFKFFRIFYLGFWYFRSKILLGYDVFFLEMNNKVFVFYFLFIIFVIFNNIVCLFY